MTFTVRLTVTYQRMPLPNRPPCSCFGAGAAAIYETPSNGDSVCWQDLAPNRSARATGICGSPSSPTSVSIQITRAPSEPFRLDLSVGCVAPWAEFVDIEGTLTFEDLPSGVTIRSCQGYGEDPTTAAAAGSWGRLKIRHR